MSRRARLLPLASALIMAALIMALPFGLMAKTRYFCRSMDRVMEACCCGSKPEASSAKRSSAERSSERTALLRPSECCEALRSASREAAPATRHATPDLAPIALLTTLTVSEWLLIPARALSAEDEADAHYPLSGAGPPLYIENCALLT